MNKNIFKIALSVMMGAAMTLTSCTKEPDESDLYTFTGQTIQDYLEENDAIFHQFNIIMKRSGYDRMMDTYGQYTCLAPINEGVIAYCDSLYNDPKAKVPHNGMTENSVNGLTDEQCREIALYHLCNQINMYSEQLSVGDENGREVFTMLNVPFTTKINADGLVRLNHVAAIIDFDKEMTNGYVHHLDKVIPRNTQDIGTFMENLSEYSIFFSALEKTGLLDSLTQTKKPKTYSLEETKGRPGSSMQGPFYCPEECKLGFTIFAETDEVFKKANITDFPSLEKYCQEVYKDAQNWYDYPGMESKPISVSNDYKSPQNVVNMFIRYHIVKASMPVNKLIYARDAANENWNFAFGGEPYDYYETMLPHTIMKIWQPLYSNSGAQTNIWINRWRPNNTLTDEIGTYGSDAMHDMENGYKGCRINPSQSNKKAYNGYVHSIEDILVYNERVVKGTLHERIRIDAGTILYELINNNIRFATGGEIGAFNKLNGDGTMTRLPLDYFDNLKSYNEKTKLAWYTQGPWRAWEADQLSGWDENDFAIRLPPVPAGDYEIRIIYPPMSNSGLQQYYIGTTNDPSSMIPLGLPVDARYPNSGNEADRQATGYMLSDEFDDFGVASDLVMRNHGYMRAPASFSRGTYNQVKTRISEPAELIATISNCCRYEEGYGTSMMRKILGTYRFEKGKDHWLRIKNLLKNYDQLGFSIDFIELVPLDIVNSQDYTEDWY